MSIDVKVKIIGLDKVLAETREMKRNYPKALAAAILQEGYSIMAESKKLCPVETGRLINTAFVSPPLKTNDKYPKVLLGYGTNYALAIHEKKNVRRWSSPGSGNKFLKRPLDRAKSGYARRIADRTFDNLKKRIFVKQVPESELARPVDKGAAWQKAKRKQLVRKHGRA